MENNLIDMVIGQYRQSLRQIAQASRENKFADFLEPAQRC